MAGAAGYVLKQIRGTDLAGAIRTVAGGRSLLVGFAGRSSACPGPAERARGVPFRMILKIWRHAITYLRSSS
jgi:hypothetical protein